jgi:hypothetical protein
MLRPFFSHARMTFSALVCTIALAAASTSAQTTTGVVAGIVRDSAGAVMPGVTVTITDLSTNAQSETVSDARGGFLVPQLSPGTYRIDASLQGFKTFSRTNIPLAVQQQVRIDVVLEVGQLTEAVDVVANASVLDTMTSSVGKVVDNARIRALPLNTRNIYGLIYLTPGVAGGIGNSHNQVGYSVNGVRGGLMETLVDGSSAAFPTVNGFHGISVFPSVDAVQEFKVQGGNYSAEFGRSLGSVLNLVYKSGSNAFHGTGYEFYRDSQFDANTYFNKARNLPLADFDRSQFGGMTGGPIARNRSFFMVSYEGLRQNSFRELLTTVPTALERAGDFSQTRGANGQPIVIYDPATTVANPSGSGYVRSPFQGNRVPANRMDPVALNVMRYWPEANQPGDAATGRNNLRQRIGEGEHGQLRRADRSRVRVEPPDVRALLVSSLARRTAAAVPRRHGCGGRANQPQRLGTELRSRLHRSRRGQDSPQRAARVRAQSLSLRESSARLLAHQPRLASRHRSERRSADVSGVLGERRHVAGRRRSPLERIQQLQRVAEPEPQRRRALPQDRVRRPDAPHQRVGSAGGRQLLVLAAVHAGPESAGDDRARRPRLRVVPARRRQLRVALSELEERRVAELLSRVVRAGRLAHHRSPDRECWSAL